MRWKINKFLSMMPIVNIIVITVGNNFYIVFKMKGRKEINE